MASRPVKSALKRGLSQVDFSSQRNIKKAFGNDEAAIRSEYSRMKSIINKRIGRLEEAGEVRNLFYRIFGRNPLPNARELSLKEMMNKMAPMARALSGAYAASLTEIKETREEVKSRLSSSAKISGDTEAAEELNNLDDKQYEKIKIIMGMIDNVVRKVLKSGDEEAAAFAAYTKRKKGDSIRVLAKKALRELDLSKKEKRDALHSLDFRWTREGKTKVNWKKIRKLR